MKNSRANISVLLLARLHGWGSLGVCLFIFDYTTTTYTATQPCRRAAMQPCNTRTCTSVLLGSPEQIIAIRKVHEALLNFNLAVRLEKTKALSATQ
jgi:hypothetical protein